jgi:hypothetical protein
VTTLKDHFVRNDIRVPSSAHGSASGLQGTKSHVPPPQSDDDTVTASGNFAINNSSSVKITIRSGATVTGGGTQKLEQSWVIFDPGYGGGTITGDGDYNDIDLNSMSTAHCTISGVMNGIHN